MKSEKIKNVEFNNRTKVLNIKYQSKKSLQIHYAQLGLRKRIIQASVDPETRGRTIVLEFTDGTKEFIPYDQPLFVVKDPDFILQNDIGHMTAFIKAAILKKKLSKRFLATQLQTSDNQIQRLLNPKILNKNLAQLYRLAQLVGLQVDLTVKTAA